MRGAKPSDGARHIRVPQESACSGRRHRIPTLVRRVRSEDPRLTLNGLRHVACVAGATVYTSGVKRSHVEQRPAFRGDLAHRTTRYRVNIAEW